MANCPLKNCPIELVCTKSCYWWNQDGECDWSQEAEEELERGTLVQLREYDLATQKELADLIAMREASKDYKPPEKEVNDEPGYL